MTHPINSIPFKRLMEKWALEQSELVQIIDRDLLRVYFDPYYNPKYASVPLALSQVPSLDFADYDPEKLFFRRTEIEDFETKYRNYLPSNASLYSVNSNLKTKEKKISPIANMIVCNEINSACEGITCKTFTERTLRDWIKDLCPNRLQPKNRQYT